MDHTKIDTADLDSPCRELSNNGLGIAVALLVRQGINVVCARVYWKSNPAVSRIKFPEKLFFLVFPAFKIHRANIVNEISNCHLWPDQLVARGC